ncbi:putative histone deacetylase complex subunit cti6 [Echria macrotheca]|uniref:Histone deacetylase complex subunit cti6 n=1 Tax=Echria macrotheca TaxID=438768 RepID=A0AAJ0F0L6_9PEZI|nr:putative histone deacetylase complex subunit cti6 [Echria macrotheca]
MAGSDPRRSSRARVAQPQSQIASVTSNSSSRTDRNSRSYKGGSPLKSNSTGSLSSESLEDTITAEDTFASRRRTRGQGEDRERAPARTETIEMGRGDEDMQDEDEAVRCICGYDDYPGPPPLDEDSKLGSKDAGEIDPIFATDVTDDAAGFFVQCDTCKVWQHGACVGIMTEESSPDEYFCEACRRDLHKIFTSSNGQQYSHYLPLKRSSRAASRSASINKDGTRSPPKDKESRSGRASSASQTSKRRSTMNSREAAYDEAEALRRAIEASKEDAPPESVDGAPKRAKRARSDSEEKQENPKRQRASSGSASPSPAKEADDSDDGALTRNGSGKSKSRNGTGARNQRAEKPSEREERERQRIEAANKRKGRAERRRAEGMSATILVKASEAHMDTDSDPSEELPLAARAVTTRNTVTSSSTLHVASSATPAVVPAANTNGADTTLPATVEPPPASQTTDTPSPSIAPTRIDKKRSHKKKGRNQYTRDDDSPARSQSRDIQKDDNTPSGGNGRGVGDKPHGKAKGGMSSKITMTDMKRKAAALLDFISRTQVELAGETAPDTGENSPKVNGSDSATASVNGAGDSADGAVVVVPPPESSSGPRFEKDFKELNCVEMMDSLTRRLVKWQQEYAA